MVYKGPLSKGYGKPQAVNLRSNNKGKSDKESKQRKHSNVNMNGARLPLSKDFAQHIASISSQ